MARDRAGYTQLKMKFGLFERVNHLTYTVSSPQLAPLLGQVQWGKVTLSE